MKRFHAVIGASALCLFGLGSNSHADPHGATPTAPGAEEQPLACEGTTAINDICPITGDKLGEHPVTGVYRARMLGFSSDKAKADFEAWEAKKKDGFLLRFVKPGPINDMCPIGKEAVVLDGGGTLDYAGHTIAFCCPSCGPAFEKWDTAKKDEFVQSFVSRPAVNKTCIMTGEGLDAESPSVLYLGKKVAFCCKGCARKWDLFSHAERSAKLAEAASGATPAAAPASDPRKS